MFIECWLEFVAVNAACILGNYLVLRLALGFVEMHNFQLGLCDLCGSGNGVLLFAPSSEETEL